MNEEKLVSLFGNMLEEKLDKILDKKLDEKLDKILDKKLDEKLDKILDKKLNTILDKRFEEFHIKLSKEISEVLGVFSDTINKKFKYIEATLNEHTIILKEHSKILKEHSKILNNLAVSSNANELKHQSYDSELGIINTNLYKHDSRLQQLESANFEKVAN